MKAILVTLTFTLVTPSVQSHEPAQSPDKQERPHRGLWIKVKHIVPVLSVKSI